MHLSQASFTGDRQGLGDKKKSLRESDTPQQTKRAISLLEMFWGSPTGDSLIANLRSEEEEE
jgi:hypothetical protein